MIQHDDKYEDLLDVIDDDNNNICFSESGYGSSGHPGQPGSDQGQSPGDRRSRLRKSHSSGGGDDGDEEEKDDG